MHGSSTLDDVLDFFAFFGESANLNGTNIPITPLMPNVMRECDGKVGGGLTRRTCE